MKKANLVFILFFLFLSPVIGQNLKSYFLKYKIPLNQTTIILALGTQDCDRCVNISRYYLNEIKKRTNANVVIVISSPSQTETNLLLYKQIKFTNADLENVKIIEDRNFYESTSAKKLSSLAFIENERITFKKNLSEITSIEEVPFPYHLSLKAEITSSNETKIPNLYYKFHPISDSIFIIFNAQYQIIKKIHIKNKNILAEDFTLNDSIYNHFLNSYVDFEGLKIDVLKNSNSLKEYGIPQMKLMNYGFFQQKHYFIFAFAYLFPSQQGQAVKTYYSIIEKNMSGQIENIRKLNPLPEGYYPNVRENFHVQNDTIYLAIQKAINDTIKPFDKKFYYAALFQKGKQHLNFLYFASPTLPENQIKKKYFFKYLSPFFLYLQAKVWVCPNFYPYIENMTEKEKIIFQKYKGIEKPRINDKNNQIEENFSINTIHATKHQDIAMVFRNNEQRYFGIFNNKGKELFKEEIENTLHGVTVLENKLYLFILSDKDIKVKILNF